VVRQNEPGGRAPRIIGIHLQWLLALPIVSLFATPVPITVQVAKGGSNI